jgi:hypothetical protein
MLARLRSDNADLFPNMHPTCAAALFASLFFEAGQAKSCMQQCSQTFFFRKTLTFVEEETVKAYSLQPKAYGV